MQLLPQVVAILLSAQTAVSGSVNGQMLQDAELEAMRLVLCRLVLVQDGKGLGELATSFESKAKQASPDQFLDCTRALMYIYRETRDRNRLMACFVQFNKALSGSRLSKEEKIRLIQNAVKDMKEDPIGLRGALDEALKADKIEVSPVFLILIKSRIDLETQYIEKKKLLEDALTECANVSEVTEDALGRAAVDENMHELRVFSIRNHWSSLKVQSLWFEASRFMENKSGSMHRAEVCYLVANAIWVARTLPETRQGGAVAQLNIETLKSWAATAMNDPEAHWVKRMSAEMTKLGVEVTRPIGSADPGMK